MMLKVSLILLALSASVYGQRESSLQVIETMKSLQPMYKQLQDYIVNQLTEAKLNSSALVYQLHTDVIETKERFVRAAIDEERLVLNIIEGQPETVNPSCLGFVRSSADLNVNLAGVSYTNCINEVDDTFNDTLVRFYGSLQTGEALYTVSGLFDVFEGENIFHNPENIIEKLNARLEELADDPSFIADELFDQVEGFEEDLNGLKDRYAVCLDGGVDLLYMALELARTQIVQICLGQLEIPPPEEETTVTPEVTETPEEETI